MISNYARLRRSLTLPQPYHAFSITISTRTRDGLSNVDPTLEAVSHAPIPRLRGRPRKVQLEDGSTGAIAVIDSNRRVDSGRKASKRKATKLSTNSVLPPEKTDCKQPVVTSPKPARARIIRSKKATIPLPIVPGSPHHHDLTSFLAYASRKSLKPTTNVYRGTHYEYTVASSLKALDFSLTRTGRSSDLGMDLVGHWTIPAASHTLRCIVQCKAMKPGPAMVRELEGAYVGAPAGWRGEGVLALLVCSREATKGVRDAVQRSRWPMGILQVSRAGEVKQFLWNAVAAANGLEGMGVTARYTSPSGAVLGGVDAKNREDVQTGITRTWMAKPWKPQPAPRVR